MLDPMSRQTIPVGPHDQPQSMCPAFGSLRVGLRMRRTATVSERFGLLRLRIDLHLAFLWCQAATVGYVPFNSETLVTGKLYEDIRDAVHEMADPETI